MEPDREDDDLPWLLVSMDFTVADTVCETLRLDFDAAGIRGGWSPTSLNWDGDVRAEAAGIDIAGPDGICISAAGRVPGELARLAADWFAEHRRHWSIIALAERNTRRRALEA